MAYTLRLPDALDTAARAKADYLGISLNALLCVALDAYLREPAAPASHHAGAAPAAEPPSKPIPAPASQPKLTRAEKQAIYEREKAEFKRLNGQR